MLTTIRNYFVVMIAIEHIWFMMMVLFRWKKGFAKDLMDYDPEQAEESVRLAGCVAVHSGLIGFGLLWMQSKVFFPPEVWQPYVGEQARNMFFYAAFFAGLYNGKAINKILWYLQAAPAFLAIVLFW